MSYVETLHADHQARLRRIASRAIVQPVAQPVAIRERVGAVDRPIADFEYEYAWHVAIVGYEIEAYRPTKKLTIEEIQRVCAQHFNVTKIDILSQRRTRNVTRPRQIAMYLAKTMTLKSLPEIGRRFGGKDHTTVLHAVRKIEALLQDDPEIAGVIHILTERLKPQE